MIKFKHLTASAFCIILIFATMASAQTRPELVRGETLVEAPAIGQGLDVHNLFQSHMVLQRDKPIAIWGWATPGETVTVSFARSKASVTADDDRTWKVTLPAQPVNTQPQTMTIQGQGNTITLDDILIGDVWVLGGQSNMEHPISRIEDGKLEIASANFPMIRHLSVAKQFGPKAYAGFPKQYQWNGWFNNHERQGYWDVCTPETVRDLSGIGYVFARRLYMATQVPIGVIDASVGGTTIETWTPDMLLRKMDDPLLKSKIAEYDKKAAEYSPEKSLADRIKFYNDRTERLRKQGKDVSNRTNPPTEPGPNPKFHRNRPGNSYAGIIAPLTGLQVKGAIWHQGYNNCFNGTPGAAMYAKVFPVMIKSWREAFGNPEMAFGILSLCTQGKKQEHDDYTSHMADPGPFVREAQYQTYLTLYEAGDKNVGFVSTYDLDRSWYHPGLKIPAGERAAKWALATQYDINAGDWKPPMINETIVEDGRIIVKLDGNVGAVGNGLPMQGFAIAGKDRKFHPADATFLVIGKDNRGRDRLDKKQIVLTSPMVPEPVAFRYAWARMPMANVQAGLIPMPTQRSDDWPLEQTPDLGFELTVTGEIDRAQRRELINTLKQIDAERRIAEAQAVLESAPE